mmetsp:Transcript_7225/g.8204  ORF Transcript_7225/g.8204 Transcript_7225/m.8204 type:complete len:82 (+) Transcript_7225:263-508(+)
MNWRVRYNQRHMSHTNFLNNPIDDNTDNTHNTCNNDNNANDNHNYERIFFTDFIQQMASVGGMVHVHAVRFVRADIHTADQ